MVDKRERNNASYPRRFFARVSLPRWAEADGPLPRWKPRIIPVVVVVLSCLEPSRPFPPRVDNSPIKLKTARLIVPRLCIIHWIRRGFGTPSVRGSPEYRTRVPYRRFLSRPRNNGRIRRFATRKTATFLVLAAFLQREATVFGPPAILPFFSLYPWGSP